MKYAVIGTGKTGRAILDKLPAADIVAQCNSRQPLTKEMLGRADIGIVFVPAKALADMLPLLLESGKPIVIGTTGYAWPEDFDEKLRRLNLPWITGQNFSIGLNVMRYFAQRIEKSLNALKPGQLRLGMSEKHHVHKLDAPSGTALYIAGALGFPPQDIAVTREGEARGTHTVSFALPHDAITLTHEAIDRAAFAEGVLLACQQVARLPAGLHFFEKLADDMIETYGEG